MQLDGTFDVPAQSAISSDASPRIAQDNRHNRSALVSAYGTARRSGQFVAYLRQGWTPAIYGFSNFTGGLDV